MSSASVPPVPPVDETTRAEVRAIVDAGRRLAVHYGLWFARTAEHSGIEAAVASEAQAGDRLMSILFDRLGRESGFAVSEGLPEPLLRLTPAQRQSLLQTLAVLWLAADGVWFQAVEQREGMAQAKKINDACWSWFSPLEATRIMALTGLGEGGGLAALAEALRHRLYASINDQEIEIKADGAVVLWMRNCRVQAARQRQGLADYPCKSAGMVEYTTFAQTIDPRLTCTCLACPPDPHPADWFCAWRFQLAEPGPQD